MELRVLSIKMTDDAITNQPVVIDNVRVISNLKNLINSAHF